MNPVLMLTHNCLEMTKRCVESVMNQNIPSDLTIIDNGSFDGIREWLNSDAFTGCSLSLPHNVGVSYGWNVGLEGILRRDEHCLVVNNDVILPPWFYRELLSYDVPFVTGVSVDNMDAIKEVPMRVPLVGHPDFSAFLIRRDAWNKIGPFDVGMKFYAQDCDYHVRACQAGITLKAASLPFYHERSSTLNLASSEEREEIQLQANRDREYFLRKYGFSVGSEEYQRATGAQVGTKVPFPGEFIG